MQVAKRYTVVPHSHSSLRRSSLPSVVLSTGRKGQALLLWHIDLQDPEIDQRMTKVSKVLWEPPWARFRCQKCFLKRLIRYSAQPKDAEGDKLDSG